MTIAKQLLCTDDRDEHVIKEYSDTVYRLAFSQMKNKSDADDIYQEVFFRYVRKKPRFESKEHQKAWFIRVTLNCCKSTYSSAWRTRAVPLDDSMSYIPKEQNDLQNELQKLPQKYLAVIHLFYYEDMSLEEISNAIGISLSAVKMRLSRARDMLRTFMKEEDYV
jgi:RNA polymerase sigma-70 factor (ECF subfamily)